MGKFVNLRKIKEQAELIETLAAGAACAVENAGRMIGGAK